VNAWNPAPMIRVLLPKNKIFPKFIFKSRYRPVQKYREVILITKSNDLMSSDPSFIASRG